MKISKDWKTLVMFMLMFAAPLAVATVFDGCGSDSYDVAPPENKPIIINDDAASTNSPNVTLTLNGEDPGNIVAYYVSENSTAPPANDLGWVAVTSPSTTYHGTNIPFTLSAGYGTKTVYVWFKNGSDAVLTPKGNSDSIGYGPSSPGY